LVGVTTQFDLVAPKFEIEPSRIEILNSPTAFYETLKVVEADNELRPTS
jgi:CDP-diacylglycerol--glycerol-3-phosphate 3-phosphatidyltransferase